MLRFLSDSPVLLLLPSPYSPNRKVEEEQTDWSVAEHTTNRPTTFYLLVGARGWWWWWRSRSKRAAATGNVIFHFPTNRTADPDVWLFELLRVSGCRRRGPGSGLAPRLWGVRAEKTFLPLSSYSAGRMLSGSARDEQPLVWSIVSVEAHSVPHYTLLCHHHHHQRENKKGLRPVNNIRFSTSPIFPVSYPSCGVVVMAVNITLPI